MTKFWKFTPWLTRLMLLAPTIIFALIASRYLFDPIQQGQQLACPLTDPWRPRSRESGSARFLSHAPYLRYRASSLNGEF